MNHCTRARRRSPPSRLHAPFLEGLAPPDQPCGRLHSSRQSIERAHSALALRSASFAIFACRKKSVRFFLLDLSGRHDMMPIALLCNSSVMGFFEFHPEVAQTQQVPTVRFEKTCRNADMH
jgi:hypothetical protein